MKYSYLIVILSLFSTALSAKVIETTVSFSATATKEEPTFTAIHAIAEHAIAANSSTTASSSATSSKSKANVLAPGLRIIPVNQQNPNEEAGQHVRIVWNSNQ